MTSAKDETSDLVPNGQTWTDADVVRVLTPRLKVEEGWVRKVYKDSEGLDTIGCGRLLDKGRGGGFHPTELEFLTGRGRDCRPSEYDRLHLDDTEIAYLLANDILRTIKDLDHYLAWWRKLDLARACVLCDMTFNMGIGNKSVGMRSFVNTLASMQRGDYAAAAKGMRKSKWARQVKGRAPKLAAIMESGVYVPA